jgi:hypothetical protein
MSYTTITQVAGMFPTFTRNGPKGPSDTLIQNFIDDVAGEIDAILQRRFQEAYASLGFTAWQGSFSTNQLNLLEKINRYGAGAQLAEVFETSGIAAAAREAKGFEDEYRELCDKLNARDATGRPLAPGGDYDYLFDPLAKVETPRPQLGGVAGGDQYPGGASSEDSTNVFRKFDRGEF